MNRFPIRRQRLAIISALLLWCVALLLFRVVATESRGHIYLAWNLLLALIPLLCSSTLPQRASVPPNGDASTRRLKWPQLSMLFLWLLFLPNAPYILTDLIHLESSRGMPQWYDLALILSCAGAGLFFCYLSLLDVQRFIARNFGAKFGWLVAAGSLLLCGFGIYLGRFLRWNSWDLLTRPSALLSNVHALLTESGEHPNPFAVTLIYGVGLLLGYLALRVAAASMTEENETPQPAASTRDQT